MAQLIKHIRAIARFTAFTGVLLAAFATMPLHRKTLASRARWLQASCRRALRALGVRCSSNGATTRGEVIVANHVSYLDILVLAASRPVVFVAKREVRAWPVFGWLAQYAGTRFIDRERRSDVLRVAQEFSPAVAAGVGVVLFLEGTSTNGRTVKSFKSSLLAPAVTARWGVVPAAIAYRLPSGHNAETEVCWWGDMTLAPHLMHLLALPRIEARVDWAPTERNIHDRKAFALFLHERVTDLLSSLHRWQVENSGSEPDWSSQPAETFL